jgi:hypothetical protein
VHLKYSLILLARCSGPRTRYEVCRTKDIQRNFLRSKAWRLRLSTWRPAVFCLERSILYPVPGLLHFVLMVSDLRLSTDSGTIGLDQERLLSNRLLTFTDSQVFFDCSQGSRNSSISYPTRMPHIPQRTRKRASISRIAICGSCTPLLFPNTPNDQCRIL